MLSAKLLSKKGIPIFKALLVPPGYQCDSLFIVLMKRQQDLGKGNNMWRDDVIGFKCLVVESSGRFVFIYTFSLQHGSFFYWATALCKFKSTTLCLNYE